MKIVNFFVKASSNKQMKCFSGFVLFGYGIIGTITTANNSSFPIAGVITMVFGASLVSEAFFGKQEIKSTKPENE